MTDKELIDLRLERDDLGRRVRQLAKERDSLLELNRLLEFDRKVLIEEVMELRNGKQQTRLDHDA